MRNTQYCFDTLQGLYDLKHDRDEDDIYHMTGRRIVIAELAKGTPELLELVGEFAQFHGLSWQVYHVTGNDGSTGRALWVARDHGTIDQAIGYVEACRAGTLSRLDLQDYLGQYLGFNRQQIAEFQESEIGRTCGCDLCGGPVPITATEICRNKGRTMEYVRR